MTLFALALLASGAVPSARAEGDDLVAQIRGLGELIAIQKRLNDLELEVGAAMRAQAASAAELARVRGVLAGRQQGLDRTRAWVRARVRALSRGRHRSLLTFLLSARDLSERRKHRRFQERALAHDVAGLGAYLEEVRAVRRLAREIAAQEARARAAQEAVTRRRDELVRLKRAREAELAALARRGHSLRSEVRRMESVFRLRGRLPHPVQGTVELPYGMVREPPFGTVAPHPGWRYRTAESATVSAIFTGRVVFARELAGYGNVVILDHGRNVHTLSAHLRDIAVREGDAVGTGQPLGAVGSDALRGPGLYFEVRYRGRPVDPARWITAQPPPTATTGVDTAQARK
jgi:septal ring factor EnvC (AmiA/AmiB activator)